MNGSKEMSNCKKYFKTKYLGETKTFQQNSHNY